MWALALWPKTICVLDLRPVGWPAWYQRALELPTRTKIPPTRASRRTPERWSAGALELEGEGLGLAKVTLLGQTTLCYRGSGSSFRLMGTTKACEATDE